jgi:hypothetical protein
MLVGFLNRTTQKVMKTSKAIGDGFRLDVQDILNLLH